MLVLSLAQRGCCTHCPALFAPLRRRLTGEQFHFSELRLQQGRTRPGVISSLLSRCQAKTAILRAVATAATCLPRRLWIRTKNARSGPGARPPPAASTSMPRPWARPCFVTPVTGGTVPGLAHGWVEAEIAHQFLRRGKAADIADGGEQPDGNSDMHAADGHQPLHARVLQSPLRERPIERGKIRRPAIKVRQMAPDRQPLVRAKGWASSHFRPVTLNNSPGNGGMRLACSTL